MGEMGMVVQFIGCLGSRWACRGATREPWALCVVILPRQHECMPLLLEKSDGNTACAAQ